MSLRCWWSHKWQRVTPFRWRCERCGTEPKPCGNCGGQHNPDHIVLCIRERSTS